MLDSKISSLTHGVFHFGPSSDSDFALFWGSERKKRVKAPAGTSFAALLAVNLDSFYPGCLHFILQISVNIKTGIGGRQIFFPFKESPEVWMCLRPCLICTHENSAKSPNLKLTEKKMEMQALLFQHTSLDALFAGGLLWAGAAISRGSRDLQYMDGLELHRSNWGKLDVQSVAWRKNGPKCVSGWFCFLLWKT